MALKARIAALALLVSLSIGTARAATHEQIAGTWVSDNKGVRITRNDCNTHPANLGGAVVIMEALGNRYYRTRFHNPGITFHALGYRNSTYGEVVGGTDGHITSTFNVNLRGSRPRAAFEFWFWCNKSAGKKVKYVSSLVRP